MVVDTCLACVSMLVMREEWRDHDDTLAPTALLVAFTPPLIYGNAQHAQDQTKDFLKLSRLDLGSYYIIECLGK